jgi:hypothetical protein
MNGTKVLKLALAAAVVGAIGLAGGRALADVKWVETTVRVPYTYYAWETQTQYQSVQRPVTVTRYRMEQQLVTTMALQKRLIAEEYRDAYGYKHTRYRWETTEIPVQEYRWVRVAYTETVMQWVTEPYTVRVRVERTGYRSETRVVAVRSWEPRITVQPHITVQARIGNVIVGFSK